MRQSRPFNASASVERAGGVFNPMWNSLDWLAAMQASMSRSDSRHISWAKAMMRNKSAQPRVRTPASPFCRSMMRPKLFHGTNSMTCANSVLPTFMRHSGSFKPESIANLHHKIQIVDTPKALDAYVNNHLQPDRRQINRTPLMRHKHPTKPKTALVPVAKQVGQSRESD